MSFRSDNVSPVSPEILEAMIRENSGDAPAYGCDDATRRLDTLFSELFEHEVAVFPVLTGTAANALALAALAPRFSAVLCHADAHILMDEAGACESLAGIRLVPVEGENGKIRIAAMQALLDRRQSGGALPPAVVSFAQSSEAGTVYSTDEMGAICAFARYHGLAVHMDGARFANAVVALDRSPADLTWRAGVDVLTFGATRTGRGGRGDPVLRPSARRRSGGSAQAQWTEFVQDALRVCSAHRLRRRRLVAPERPKGQRHRHPPRKWPYDDRGGADRVPAGSKPGVRRAAGGGDPGPRSRPPRLLSMGRSEHLLGEACHLVQHHERGGRLLRRDGAFLRDGFKQTRACGMTTDFYDDIASSDLSGFPRLSSGNDSFVYRIGDRVAKEYQTMAYPDVERYVALHNAAAAMLAGQPYRTEIKLAGVMTELVCDTIIPVEYLGCSRDNKPLALSRFVEATNLEKLLWRPERFEAYAEAELADPRLREFAARLNAYFWDEYPTRARDELHYHVCMISRLLDRMLGVSGCYISKYNVKLQPAGGARIDLIITDLALYIDRVSGFRPGDRVAAIEVTIPAAARMRRTNPAYQEPAGSCASGKRDF